LLFFKGKGERGAVEVLGPMGDKVAGDWSQIRNEELHNLYCSSNIGKLILRTVRWQRRVARMEDGIYYMEDINSKSSMEQTSWSTEK
jgi:hypothetical protein